MRIALNRSAGPAVGSMNIPQWAGPPVTLSALPPTGVFSKR